MYFAAFPETFGCSFVHRHWYHIFSSSGGLVELLCSVQFVTNLSHNTRARGRGQVQILPNACKAAFLWRKRWMRTMSLAVVCLFLKFRGCLLLCAILLSFCWQTKFCTLHETQPLTLVFSEMWFPGHFPLCVLDWRRNSGQSKTFTSRKWAHLLPCVQVSMLLSYWWIWLEWGKCPVSTRCLICLRSTKDKFTKEIRTWSICSSTSTQVCPYFFPGIKKNSKLQTMKKISATIFFASLKSHFELMKTV